MSHNLHFPIIEIRKDSFYVLNDYGAKISSGIIKTRHNLLGNTTNFIIDSTGCVLELTYINNDKNAIHSLIGILWNISHDFYSYSINCGRNIEWFRSIMTKYSKSDNPDISEMAHQFLHDCQQHTNETPLTSAISSFNL